ncbi:MAG: 3-phosphoshikimate 1-carboxyvinyltransferase [Ruminococcaceae bacterium]|nr:3-phosphoshikimate 1-carboxyvinyltransferase [Oscillospiraceae bacterium]
MEQIIIPKHLRGTVTVPPSKSQAHRAVIAAALANGQSTVSNLAWSDDIQATIGAMKALGAHIITGENSLTVRGATPNTEDNTIIDCCESGSTLRFLIPLAWCTGKRVTFTGKGRLMQRPLTPYFDICKQDNICYTQTTDTITFSGKLQGGTYYLPGNISSQFITGLLFALPLLKQDSIIELTTKAESVGYIDMTLDILNRFGVNITNKNYERFIIPGNQHYTPCSVTVEGDYSQAAFYLCANAMGSQIDIKGLHPASCQGDKEILSIIEQFGSPLKGTTIDVSQIPDLVPVLAVLATQAEGTTRIINAARLRIKESDRLATVTEALSRFGAQIEEQEDALIIHGKTPLSGCIIDSHNDHRIAMASAIAATVATGTVTICGSECVKKSYGKFWEDYSSLAK